MIIIILKTKIYKINYVNQLGGNRIVNECYNIQPQNNYFLNKKFRINGSFVDLDVDRIQSPEIYKNHAKVPIFHSYTVKLAHISIFKINNHYLHMGNLIYIHLENILIELDDIDP